MWYAAAHLYKGALRASLLGVLSLLFAAFVGPVFIQSWESTRGIPIQYEAGMRLYLALAMGFALSVTGLYFLPRWNAIQRFTWWVLFGAFFVVLAIFWLDWESLLQQEYSWIRYPTAACLILAGFIGLRIAHNTRKREGSRLRSWFWVLVSSGFLFGGADELLELHEGVGKLFRFTSHPALFADLVTVSYFAAGLGILYLMCCVLSSRVGEKKSWKWRDLGEMGCLQPGSSKDHAWLIQGYFAAVGVFGVAQFFDTADKHLLTGLRWIADWLVINGHQFPDLWYLFYHPRQFMNSLEEVLECLAAVLLFAFTLQLLLGRKYDGPRKPVLVPGMKWARATFLLGCSVLFLMGWNAATSGSPLTNGREVTLVPHASGQTRDDGSLPYADPVSEWAVLPDGQRFVANSDGGEIVRFGVEGNEMEHLSMRLMFRDLRGVAYDPQGNLYFLTHNDGNLSFLPPILWRMSLQ